MEHHAIFVRGRVAAVKSRRAPLWINLFEPRCDLAISGFPLNFLPPICGALDRAAQAVRIVLKIGNRGRFGTTWYWAFNYNTDGK